MNAFNLYKIKQCAHVRHIGLLPLTKQLSVRQIYKNTIKMWYPNSISVTKEAIHLHSVKFSDIYRFLFTHLFVCPFVILLKANYEKCVHCVVLSNIKSVHVLISCVL